MVNCGVNNLSNLRTGNFAKTYIKLKQTQETILIAPIKKIESCGMALNVPLETTESELITRYLWQRRN